MSEVLVSVAPAPELTNGAPLLERAFESEPREGELLVERVEGELPRGLAGTYYLSGPARFAAGELRYRNWLDGDGMVIAARFGGGGTSGPNAVRVRQRFVETAKLAAERAAGRALYRTFGTAFAGDRLVHGVTVASPVNLSAWPFAGRLLAFGEQGQPWELDPETLSTRGPGTFDGAVTAATPFSGHPKVDPHTGELVTFGVSFAPQEPMLHFFRFAPDGGLALRARRPLPFPASIHDFALAARHAVFHAAPHLLDLHALRGGSTVLAALSWRPELGSRLLVLDRKDGALVADVPVGERYCLHLLNAYEGMGEQEARLTVDLVELDRPVYGDYHELPELFVDPPAGRAVRYELDLRSGTLLSRVASRDLGTPDFPTLDRRLATRENRHGWVLQVPHGERGRKFFTRLLHLRWDEGRVEGEWNAPPLVYLAGEPAFAPVGDDGVLVVPLWDAAAGKSALALFDPFAVAAGPRAVVRLGARMPLGFHSFWSAAAS